MRWTPGHEHLGTRLSVLRFDDCLPCSRRERTDRRLGERSPRPSSSLSVTSRSACLRVNVRTVRRDWSTRGFGWPLPEVLVDPASGSGDNYCKPDRAHDTRHVSMFAAWPVPPAVDVAIQLAVPGREHVSVSPRDITSGGPVMRVVQT